MVRDNCFSVRSYIQKSNAFTMIELIFAIVIVGVTLLTIPLMIQTNNKSIERSLAGEAIFLASAVAAQASTLVWDNRSIVDTGDDDVYILAKILDVTDAGTTFGRIDTNTNIRNGGLFASRHRQFFDYNTTAANGYTRPLQTGKQTLDLEIDGSANDIAGYKYAYNVKVERMYVPDAVGSLQVGSSGQTNLKLIEVSIPVEFDSADTYNVVLRTYTANIGEVDYEKRSF